MGVRQKGFSTRLSPRHWLESARRDIREAWVDPIPNLLAGATVAVVALPLALAFGLIAFGPEYGPAAGLWSAIIVGSIAAIFGGAPYAISGPTGVLAVFTAGLVLDHGGFTSPDAILFGFLAIALSGVFQIFFGIFRLGRVIEFIPYPVITGFMNGIALIIFWSGLKDVLAPSDAPLAAPLEALQTFATGGASATVYAAAVLAAASLALTFLYPKLTRRLPASPMRDVLQRIPGSLVALLALTALAIFAAPFAGVRHIHGLPSGLPAFALDFGFFVRHPEWIRDLILGALGLALISSMDTLLTCVIVDSVVGKRHASNRELVAQGVGNSLAGAFGANQACGAAVRTMVNVRNGGRTRLSGVAHAVILAVLVFLGAGLTTLIPIAVLSGILLTTAIGMVEWRAIFEAHRAPKSDTAVMLVTTFVTVQSGLIEAVIVGVVLAALLFIKRMTDLTDFVGEPEFVGSERRGLEDILDETLVYEVRGPLFFGAATKFTRTFEHAALKGRPILILRMNAVTAIDETGLRSLEVIVERVERNGQTLILAHVPTAAKGKLDKFGLTERIGAANVVDDFPAAVVRARALLGRAP